MKTTRVVLSLLLVFCMLLTGLSLFACTENPADNQTENPTDQQTDSQNDTADSAATEPATVPVAATETDAPEAPTSDESATDEPATDESASEQPTEQETTVEDLLWHPAEGPFNQGNVTYRIETETEFVDSFPKDKVGSEVKTGDKGVITLFSSDFEGKIDDLTLGGQLTPRGAGLLGIVDGSLVFPYTESTANHLPDDGWSTVAPSVQAPVTDYVQVQLSTEWFVASPKGEGAWMGAIWGCYQTSTTAICDNPGSGLWISFNAAGNLIQVYNPTNQSWPAGCAKVHVKGVNLGEFNRTSIVCTPDYTTYVYVSPIGAAQPTLQAVISFADGKMTVKDGDGETVAAVDADTKGFTGGGFILFTHAGGGVYMDSLSVTGCSKGDILEKKSITATPAEGKTLGLDMTDKTDLVFINYSVWFDAILGGGTEKVTDYNNVTEVLAGKRNWGGIPSFHYWAKPAQGYYRSSDTDAIRNNMTLLYEAGVDAIVLDLTNANDGYIGASAWVSYIQKPCDALFDTIMEMRAEGLGTPYVIMWSGTSNGPLYQALYDNYYNVEKWKDCFVYWDGLPLLLTTHTDPKDFIMSDLFTVRQQWGLNGDHANYHWSFLNVNNYDSVSCDDNGNPEQVSVAVASQETYMSNTHTAHGRNRGIFWNMQWQYAFRVHPKVVGVTWWNEWTAQRLSDNLEQAFTDNFTQEYSRDIEPMEGGHGDQYYQWLKTYISYYKAGLDCPLLVEEGAEKVAEREIKRIFRD